MGICRRYLYINCGVRDMSKINQSRIDKILSKKEVFLDTITPESEHWIALSQANKTKHYVVEFTNDMEQAKYECECPSFKYDEDNTPPTCKHIEAIKQLKYKLLTDEETKKGWKENL